MQCFTILCFLSRAEIIISSFNVWFFLGEILWARVCTMRIWEIWEWCEHDVNLHLSLFLDNESTKIHAHHINVSDVQFAIHILFPQEYIFRPLDIFVFAIYNEYIHESESRVKNTCNRIIIRHSNLWSQTNN